MVHMSFQIFLFDCFSSTPNRTPLPEQDTAEAQEASDFVLETTDHGTRETIPQTEIPRLRREIGAR